MSESVMHNFPSDTVGNVTNTPFNCLFSAGGEERGHVCSARSQD
jgi:hypothetical protein